MIVKDAVALVTGASSGIGAATAERLAARGARVLIHGRDKEALTRLADRIGATPLVADFAEPGGADRLAAAALATAGDRVDILVANAGQGWAGAFADMPPAAIDHIVQVNLTAPVRLTHAILPAMRKNDGFLAYVTSIVGRVGVADESVYAAAKAGLDVFAESLRLELRGTGIRVGVFIPGVVDTAFFARRGQPYTRTRPRPLPVGPVADALVRMIETGRAEMYRPRWMRGPVALRGALPGPYRALVSRFGDR
jgi:short-subunit dehydrogenase